LRSSPSRFAEHTHEHATACQKTTVDGLGGVGRQPKSEMPPAGKSGARGPTRGPSGSSPSAFLRHGATDARPRPASALPQSEDPDLCALMCAPRQLVFGPSTGFRSRVDCRRISPALPDPATAQQCAVPFGTYPSRRNGCVGRVAREEIAMSLLAIIKPNGPSGFGYGSTAEGVTAGLSLDGRSYLLTGCNSGLGLETLRVLTLLK
jgi:hypothetical protein